jgi:hypothetical protein
MPTFGRLPSHNVPIDEFADAASYVRGLAAGAVDVAIEGATSPATAAAQIAPYAAAGATWWIEALGWWRGGHREALARITDGPPPVPEDSH